MTRQVRFRCGKLTLIEPLRPAFCMYPLPAFAFLFFGC